MLNKLKKKIFDFICKFVDKKKLIKALEDFYTNIIDQIELQWRRRLVEFCYLLAIAYTIYLIKVATHPKMVEYLFTNPYPSDGYHVLLVGRGTILRVGDEYFSLATPEYHVLLIVDLFRYLRAFPSGTMFTDPQVGESIVRLGDDI